MEDLAASLVMPHSHSAPLYLLYDVAGFAKHSALPLPLDDDGDDGFEFATATAKNGGGDAALRACASDVSAAFADELFRAGVLLPLRLPPRLQRPAYSAGASAATSPTSSVAAANRSRRHTGFDPFAVALEKVRREGGAAAAAPRRARSVSPLRGSATAAAAATVSAHKKNTSSSAPCLAGGAAAAQKAGATVAARPTCRTKRGVKNLLCRAVMASAAAAAPARALRPRSRKDGVSYRPGLLGCDGEAMLVRRPKATVHQQAAGSRRALGDASNLLHDRAALANPGMPLVDAGDKGKQSSRTTNDAGDKRGKAIKLNNKDDAGDKRGKAIKQNNKDKPQAIVTTYYSEEQTLTSVLTNCSMGLTKTPAYDIDTPDALNELAVVEYVLRVLQEHRECLLASKLHELTGGDQ
ncbi:hypothetical protein ACP70R_030081 [Stipagrostis hirtigluma subsp. patula]